MTNSRTYVLSSGLLKNLTTRNGGKPPICPVCDKPLEVGNIVFHKNSWSGLRHYHVECFEKVQLLANGFFKTGLISDIGLMETPEFTPRSWRFRQHNSLLLCFENCVLSVYRGSV